MLLFVLALFFLSTSAFTDDENWIAFKDKYNKHYESEGDDRDHFIAFQRNFHKFEGSVEHNEEHTSYSLGITRYSDLTEDELKHLLSMPEFEASDNNKTFHASTAKNRKFNGIYFDWRNYGAVLDVEDQGFFCDSSWAFSAKGAIEGQLAIKYGKRTPLSAQELVDCSFRYGNEGCCGGWMHKAFQYVQDHGILSKKAYEYTGTQAFCKKRMLISNKFSYGPRVVGYGIVDKNEDALLQALRQIGPISIGLNFDFGTEYVSGIYNNKYCPRYKPTHSALLVGYGIDNGTCYWLIKNSWGTDWGEEGYFRIERNKNICGIANHAMFPIVN